MWPFKSRTLLKADVAQWHIDGFAWLFKHLQGQQMVSDSRLILPKSGFFTTEALSGHKMAEAVFLQVKTYCGMADWPVNLVSDIEVYEPSTNLIQVAPRRTPLGMFLNDHSEGVSISYAPKLLKSPPALIATFAHELSHYLIHSIDDDLPCEDDEEEFLTDLCACFLGFGVFMANSAFVFEQWRDSLAGTQGWRTQKSGYLPESDLVFDLALFLTAKRIEPKVAMDCLKPHLGEQLKLAMRDVTGFTMQGFNQE